MRSIPEQRIAEFQEQDYQRYFGISKLEFDRMLKALQEAYRQEHKRKTRFTKISMMDKLILTLIYRYEYRTMESIAKEYEVSLDHCRQHPLGGAHAAQRRYPANQRDLRL